jgi:hypothetical protein
LQEILLSEDFDSASGSINLAGVAVNTYTKVVEKFVFSLEKNEDFGSDGASPKSAVSFPDIVKKIISISG